MIPSLTLVPEPAPTPGEGPLLLCVEDEAAMREMMARELQHAGYRVLSAGTVHEAFEHFQREHEDIALVISDLRLPGGTALDLFARMKALVPDPRIVVCTGMLLPNMHDQLRAAGVTRYLFKPFRMRELLDTVRRHLAVLEPVRHVEGMPSAGEARASL